MKIIFEETSKNLQISTNLQSWVMIVMLASEGKVAIDKTETMAFGMGNRLGFQLLSDHAR